MKAFHFQFETLQKVRKARENESLLHWMEAKRARMAGEAYRDTLREELEKALIRREKLGISEATSANHFQIENDYLTGLKLRIEHVGRAIQKALKVENTALERYTKHRQDREAVDKLREKSWAEYRIERRKAENDALDELYVTRAPLRKEIA